MDIDQWNLFINNASNIWIAGVMTTQNLLIGLTLWIGYKQYIIYHK
jgi:hypothetical protein